MKMRNFFSILIFFILIGNLCAVVITNDKSGYVDIEKIFENCNKTKEYRENIENKKLQFLHSVDYKQKQITDLETKYNLSTSSNTQTAVDISTDTINASVEKSSDTAKIVSKEDLKAEIDKNKTEFENYKKEFANSLEDLEKSAMYNITGAIYDKIAFVSKKYGYNVVFDKKDLAFSEKQCDLTDLVLKELNRV